MHGVAALAAHSLRRSRTLLAVLVVVLAGFEILLVAGATTLQETGTFANFAALVPPFVRQVFGDSLIVFMSFAGIVCFGYFHPMIVAALGAFVIAIATEPVAEIETRFIDVVLARPLRRAALIARSVLLLFALPALVVAVMLVATLLGLRWLAPRGAGVHAPLIAALAVNLWVLLECIGGVSLAVAAASRRRSSAAGVAGIAMLALFFLDYLARIWKPAASIAWASPFHYFDAMAMVVGRPLPASHVALLGIAGALGMALAFVLFTRRDL
jgi:ABC-type transport system involved in multi-copper enzyme maturation permease subunit